MASTKEIDIDALRAEIQQLREDVAKLSETFRETVVHRATEAAAQARDSGEKLWDEAKKQVHGVTREIEEKPIPAAITAFSLGMILGLLFSGRRS